jgi:glucose-6-phosphate 1-dehydrogenase
VIDGRKVRAYRQEEGVTANSSTETFVALRLFIDNWRWEGVPFHLVTGKCLPERVSKIALQFRRVPHQPFPPEAARSWHPSELVMSIQPEEAIVLGFQAKYPGPLMQLRPVDMHFTYRESFAVPSPDAYETLLWDVMHDDPTLFMRADQVEAAWALLTPILEVWGEQRPVGFPNYAAGTWGPAAAAGFYDDAGPRGREPDDRARG